MWFYVYILQLSNGKYYIGCTSDVKKRYLRHSQGMVNSTKPYLPVKLVWCCSFPDKYIAYDFENYLKSGSGRAFASKRLIMKFNRPIEMCNPSIG